MDDDSPTAGPWDANPEYMSADNCDVMVVGQWPEGIAGMRRPWVAIANDRANARLIAAAPDLLEAHRAVLAKMDAWVGAPSPAERSEIRSIMEAAIAKATGQEGERSPYVPGQSQRSR